MALIVMRTAYSGIVRDALDYSTALCDRNGEMIAQGLTIALHLGSFPEAVRTILTRYHDRLAPGDIFIMNDPYGSGGIHLPDIYVIKPIFIEGELEAFSCVVAHHTDVGGIVPGSNSTTATEIYQEGLRIPMLKLYDAGRPNEAIFALVEHNVRVPDLVLGDLRAEIAAARTGERVFLGLVEKYGAPQLRRYMAELLDYTEALARAEITALPDGTVTFTDHIDNDSVTDLPVVIQVALTAKGDQVEVDFAGSSPQVSGGINSPLPFTKSAVYGAMRLAMDPSIPSSAGYFRAITVRAPEASVVNPRLPAACGARGITGFRVMDAVLGALAQMVPDRIAAGGEGGNSIVSIGGYDANFHAFVYNDLISGARGAGSWGDGPEGVPHPASNNANTPVELIESSFPLRFEEYGFVPDSGGAGKHRGALAQIRQVRFLGERGVLQIRSDKRRFPPYGLAGGSSGTPSANILNPGPHQQLLPTMGLKNIQHGDVLRHVMAGGGGWGEPLERDPSLVQSDVQNEKQTVDYALEVYGVVLSRSTLEIDWAATAARRASMRGVRGP
jgi:N-methylhydantoinase B